MYVAVASVLLFWREKEKLTTIDIAICMPFLEIMSRIQFIACGIGFNTVEKKIQFSHSFRLGLSDLKYVDVIVYNIFIIG
jgi:hypothetical protein